MVHEAHVCLAVCYLIRVNPHVCLDAALTFGADSRQSNSLLSRMRCTCKVVMCGVVATLGIGGFLILIIGITTIEDQSK